MSPAPRAASPAPEGMPPAGDADLAARIVAAVKEVPEVAELSAGRLGTVATYRPGRPVHGVSVHDADVEVRVVVRPERPLPEIAESVRAAAAPLAGDRRIDVVIEDLAGDMSDMADLAGSGVDE